ncbi:MAG: nucleotidyltransferase family protein [Alicyclobacillaceae bacterium]|nr:nucleotidyltransferase family protein [Alicyclobacillaceae bacterium]
MDQPLRIGAVVLAAGMSTRMGRPKLWLPLGGKPLFRYSVETALGAGLQPVVVVAGGDAERFRRETADLDVRIVENPDFQKGMSSSLKVGIRQLQGQVDAGFILLADQPLVSRALMKALVHEYRVNRIRGVKIVRPLFQGVPGHPVVLDAALFPFFENLEGDEGGRSVLQRFREAMKVIPWDDLWTGVDVDTPEDYEMIQEWLSPEGDNRPAGSS